MVFLVTDDQDTVGDIKSTEVIELTTSVMTGEYQILIVQFVHVWVDV